MLISYKIKTGIATIIWLAKSGGVMMADRIQTKTNAYFRYLRIKAGVTKPIFVKK